MASMLQLAKALVESGESPGRAFKELQEVLERSPCHTGALLSLADLLKSEGKRLLRAIQNSQISADLEGRGRAAVVGRGVGTAGPPKSAATTTSSSQPSTAPDASRAPFLLVIRVERGSHLPAADVDGSSDPYVTLQVGKKGGKVEARKTHVKHKTLNPEWNESFTMALDEAQRSEKLVLVCKDRDMAGDDTLGRVDIDLGALRCGEEQAGWHALKGKGTGDSKLYLAYTLEVGAQRVVKHYQLASSWAFDMFAEAEQLYRRCLRIDGHQTAAKLALAELLCGQLRKPLRAQKLIDDLAVQGGGTSEAAATREVCGDDSALLCNLACLHEQAGHVGRAVDLLVRGVEASDGRDIACVYNLARLHHYSMSNPEVAQSLYAQVLQVEEDEGGMEEERREIARRTREQLRLLDSHGAAQQRVTCPCPCVHP